MKEPFASTLFTWCRRLADLNLLGPTPNGFKGSLSYRHGLGFVITSQQTSLKQPSSRDLVFVDAWNVNTGRIQAHGAGELTTTCLYHAMAYQNRAGAIFAIHAFNPGLEKTARQMGLPETDGRFSPGDSRAVDTMTADLGKGNLLIMRDDGILSIGCTADDAAVQILDLAQRAGLNC
ncbi:MAG: class II aldolase/adducin family protein [Verrucomicrobiae bacterium]|nr:class II aldolase/adducin family protein [Verrucomicrobiae bacterium]